MKLPRRDLIEHWHLFIEENLWFDAGRMWNILLGSVRINWHLMLIIFRLPPRGSVVATIFPPDTLRMPGLGFRFHLLLCGDCCVRPERCGPTAVRDIYSLLSSPHQPPPPPPPPSKHHKLLNRKVESMEFLRLLMITLGRGNTNT